MPSWIPLTALALSLLRPTPAPLPEMVFPIVGGARWEDQFDTHGAQHLKAPRLRTVLACFDGTVALTRDADGWRIILRGDDGWRAEYAHLNRSAPGRRTRKTDDDWALVAGLRDGARVRAGQPLGYVGQRAAGADEVGSHCHFELHNPYGPVNPAAALRAARVLPAPCQVSGTVLAVFPAQAEAVVRVEAMVAADGTRTTFDPPRAKRLLLDTLPPTQRPARGARVRVAGVDLGRARPLKVDALDAEASEPPAPPLDDAEAPQPLHVRWRFVGDAWTNTLPDDVFLSSAHARPGERNADSGAGVATSDPFVLDRAGLRFQIAGGKHPGECAVNLLIDGRIVRTATGAGRDEPVEVLWEIADLAGRTARLQVVDGRRVGPRGYLAVEDFALVGAPAEAAPTPSPTPAPLTAPATVTLADGTRVEGKRWLTLEATGYGPGENGRWGDRTKVGTKVGLGTVAVDPRVIPLGTRLWVEGYGFCVALDVGSAIKGRRIDLGHDDDVSANAYGRLKVRVLVLE